jgi:hypothetical protein
MGCAIHVVRVRPPDFDSPAWRSIGLENFTTKIKAERNEAPRTSLNWIVNTESEDLTAYLLLPVTQDPNARLFE